MNPLKMNELSRRHFLQNAAAAYLGVNAISGFKGEAHAANLMTKPMVNSVIYIYLPGGMSHVDSWDIKPKNKENSDAGALKTSADGIQISKFFPKLAKQMHNVSLIRSMSTGTAAHLEARYLMRTSYEKRGTIAHPELGAFASKHLPSRSGSIPSYIKVRPGSSLGRGYLEAEHAALPIGDPEKGLPNITTFRGINDKRFNERYELLSKRNKAFENRHQIDAVSSYTKSYDAAVALMKSKDLEVFDLSKEKKDILSEYSKSESGKACLLARRLVEKGVRFVDINVGGWDHHNYIYDKEVFPESAANLDHCLATLLKDLDQRGLLNTTLVAVTSEFGRTPNLDVRGGRGHHPTAFTTLLAGGPVKRGFVYGKTDDIGKKVIENKVGVDDFNATIAHIMGLNYSQEFTASERPFKIAHKGKHVKGVLA